MRPKRLTLEGFRSHERSTELDFEGRTLLAIVGPTGAGKSSILDGVAYALYGKTPRLQKEQSRLICSRSSRAHVELEFSVDGADYSVTRSLARDGKSQHVLVDKTSGDKLAGERSVTGRVEELLGLDFGGFCSSVMLAQNKFSEFLTATDTQRSGILKGVFGLDEVDILRAVAKRKRAEIEKEQARIQGARSGLPDDVPGLLTKARADHTSASERVIELRTALPEEARIDRARRAADERALREQERLAAIEATLAALPEEEQFEALARVEPGVVDAEHRAATTLAAARKRSVGALEELAVLERRQGTEGSLRDALARTRELADLEDEIADLRARAADDEAAIGALEAKVKGQEEAEATAIARHDAALADLQALDRAHAAHGLRAGLAPGDSCPVCEQTVERVPKRRAPAKLAAAEKAVATAERARQQASAALVAARQDLAVSRDRSGERARTLVAREGRAEIVTAELRKVVAEGDARAEIAARLERLAEGRAAIESARAAVDAAQRDLDARREELDVLKARRSLLAVRLAQASGSLGIRAPSEGVDARGLELLAGQARAAAERLAADARAAADAAKLAADAAEQERARLHSRLDLEAGTTLVAALAGAEGEVRVYEREIARLEVAQVQLAQLDEEDRRLSARGRLFEQLADDLAERHFLKFLLDDRRRLLSELGSARLREMTNRYRFDDDSFDVIDELNADRKRDVETLSGGETFLASLALALALAEAVTRHGGRLDCFFLDEGFGSLDPESLDLALDGIDKIVRKDRLIALVSHVRGVSESVEDRIELDKDADGMTQVKAGAARG